MTYTIGSLVRARDREWVVLPGTADDFLLLRPIGGADDEITGILPAVEPVTPAQFEWPSADQPGDHLSASLLRDALRLGFRSSAGPFRSFGSLAVEPRAYQLVPLLMALRQQTIRLLIADAAGTGKTIEAGLIVAESLANGTAKRLAVLCPPQLAEQWQSELADKFHLHAELVLPSTAARLEAPCTANQSLFDLYDHVVVSMDFIKSDRRRDEFLRTCPDLVIVDEAHTCAPDSNRRSGRHQRHELIHGLSQHPDRHLILVTGTPDSGKEGTFRSLIELLDPSLGDIVDELGDEQQRRKLASHFVQRTRADIEHYLGDETPFPRRKDSEASYALSDAQRELFARALQYARESVAITEGGRRRQRVRWWSALALLRSLASSPAAAADTLRKRAGLGSDDPIDDSDTSDIDEIGRNELLDLGDDDATGTSDVALGALASETDQRAQRRLADLARLAEAISPTDDTKLTKLKDLVDELIGDGFNPIVFCRYIPTADYVADALREHLGTQVDVQSVTGVLAPAEREARIEDLSGSARRVLVATDCLSEGINLQHSFDAVIHYDLAWSPTKHEQREARVSRFGQRSDEVRVLTYFGRDNQIDGIVLDVLLQKQKDIRKRTGVSIAVPRDSGDVMDAILEGLLLRGRSYEPDNQLSIFEQPDVAQPKVDQLHTDWEDAAERERRSRAIYAQHAIRTDEVQRELLEARNAIGGSADVERFVRAALLVHGGTLADRPDGAVDIDLASAPDALRDVVGTTRMRARFSADVKDDEEHLIRAHPFVEGLAGYVLTGALDALGDSRATRAAVTRTRDVDRRTTVLLTRGRYDVVTTRGGDSRTLLAEDAQVVAFRGPPDAPEWVDDDAVESLLNIQPEGTVAREHAQRFLGRVLEHAEQIDAHLAERATRRADELLDTHRRVRTQSGAAGIRYKVTPHLPVDVLGVYVLLPAGDEQ